MSPVWCFYGYRRKVAVHGACRLYCVFMVTLRQLLYMNSVSMVTERQVSVRV